MALCTMINRGFLIHYQRKRNRDEEDDDELGNEQIKKAKGGEDYFESYDDLSVHRLMLLDHPRTRAYLNVSPQNH